MPRFLSLSVLASLLFCAVPAQAQDLLRWETDLATAQRQAAETNRLVLVHFWGTWCPPCMEMEKSVFSKPGLGTVITPYYVPVKIQYEPSTGINEAVVKQLQVDGFPCDIIMTPRGEIVSRSKGFKSADKYVAMLNEVAQQALAQARSNGLGPAATRPPVAAQAPVAAQSPVAGAPVAAPPSDNRYGAPQPTDNRYAGYAPAVTAQVPPPAAAAPAVAPAIAVRTTDDRYASYYQSRGMAPVAATPVAAAPVAPPANIVAAPVAPPAAAAPVAPAPAPTTVIPPVVAAPAAPPVAPPAAAVAAPPAAAPTPAPAAQVATAPVAASASTSVAPPPAASKASLESQLPPGSPPLALEGYCPVTVIDKMVWTKGNPLYGAIHLNRTYLFPSAEMQQKFLANPDRYSPIISGNDPVVALEKNEIVPGRRQFGLVYEDRMILFSSKDSYEKFVKESKRYTTELQQALQSSNAVRR